MITLAVLGSVLNWVLRPLGRLEREVVEIEQGDRTRLAGPYPRELSGLAANLDALVDSERRRQTRYRNTLDNLAHSLKTPLAVMGSLLAENDEAPGELARQVERMQEQVSYQLDQARVGGGSPLALRPVDLSPIARDLKESLDKVYRDKGVRCDLQIQPACEILGEPGDLMELLGNLLDNAYKYCRKQVVFSCVGEEDSIEMTLEDDGPGWPDSHVERLTRRGQRADERAPGQGIGLAVVQDLVALYQGDLRFDTSRLGGGRVRVRLARRQAPE